MSKRNVDKYYRRGTSMLKRMASGKRKEGTLCSREVLPALCIPIANVSTSTMSSEETGDGEKGVKTFLETGGQDRWRKDENQSSGCKISGDGSMGLGSMRLTMRGLRQLVGKKGTPRASQERTTAAQRMYELKRVLLPFFGKHDCSSNGTLTPGRSISGRGRRMRVSPWDRVDSPLYKKRGTNSEGCTPCHSNGDSVRSNTAGFSNSDVASSSSKFTHSVKAYTLYRLIRGIRGSAGRNGENVDFSFFEDDFVDFECAAGKENAKSFNTNLIKMRRVWGRLRGKA